MSGSDPNAVVDFYGQWAGLYDILSTKTPGLGRLRDRTAEALALGPGDTVVEVGCGTGANLPYLRERVGPSGRVVGVDLTPGMLAGARHRVDRRGFRNVHLLRGDAARPPVRDGDVDAVVGTFVVGMLHDPGAAVDAWADVAGSGGRVALLDAAPRERRGPLDAAFEAFVALSAPPTWQVRYAESPAGRLAERVEDARTALEDRGVLVADERYARGFVRLTVGRV